MTDEIDTSNEAVERVRKFVDWPHTSPSAIVLDSPLVQITAADLAVLLAERDAERARAEKAEGALRELVAECTCHPAYSGRGLQDPECPAGLFGDIAREGLGLPPLCQHDRAALRQDEGDDE